MQSCSSLRQPQANHRLPLAEGVVNTIEAYSARAARNFRNKKTAVNALPADHAGLRLAALGGADEGVHPYIFRFNAIVVTVH